jgi:hypothetical protein
MRRRSHRSASTVGIKLKGTLKSGERIVGPPELEQCIAAAEMSLGRAGIDAQRVAKEPRRLVGVAALRFDHAQEVEGVELVGLLA